jgi:hypothetical protein
MEYQGITDYDAVILSGFLGRCIFPARVWDRTQAWMYLKGVGGTGKTTLIDIICHIIGFSNFRKISSDRNKSFFLADLYQASLVVVPDAQDDLHKVLNGTLLTNMVDGEALSINRKNRSDIQTEVRGHLLMASNRFLYEQDTGLRVYRRTLYIPWNRPIISEDQNLVQNIIHNDIGPVILKFVLAYRFICFSAKRSLFSILTPTFTGWKQDYLCAINPLAKFLGRSTQCAFYVADSKERSVDLLDYIMEDLKFSEAYKEYAIQEAASSGRGEVSQGGIDYQENLRVFMQYGCCVVNRSRREESIVKDILQTYADLGISDDMARRAASKIKHGFGCPRLIIGCKLKNTNAQKDNPSSQQDNRMQSQQGNPSSQQDNRMQSEEYEMYEEEYEMQS